MGVTCSISRRHCAQRGSPTPTPTPSLPPSLIAAHHRPVAAPSPCLRSDAQAPTHTIAAASWHSRRAVTCRLRLVACRFRTVVIPLLRRCRAVAVPSWRSHPRWLPRRRPLAALMPTYFHAIAAPHLHRCRAVTVPSRRNHCLHSGAVAPIPPQPSHCCRIAPHRPPLPPRGRPLANTSPLFFVAAPVTAPLQTPEWAAAVCLPLLAPPFRSPGKGLCNQLRMQTPFPPPNPETAGSGGNVPP